MVIIFILLFFIFSCGESYERQIDKAIAFDALSIYESNYGYCAKNITTQEENNLFTCGNVNFASGCCEVGIDKCFIWYYLNGRCRTLQTILHELYHCCNRILDHGQWVDDIKNLAYENCYE